MTHPLPQNWQSVKLGTVGKVSMCKRILKNQTTPSGDIPFYKIGTFGKEPDAFISEKIYNEFKEKYSFPKKGEILISAAGTIGRTVIYDGVPAYFQDSNIVWLSNNEKRILNSFLAHAYKRVRWNTSSGTIARLYNDNIKEIELSLPPLPEQHRIVAVLETWDKAIEKLERKIELKKNVKKGLMQKLLSGKMRLPGFTGKWETMRLGEAVVVTKGDAFTKKRLVPGDIPVIAGGQQPAYFHNQSNREGNTITVSASGAYAGYIAFHRKPIFASDCSTLEAGKANITFIYYLLKNNQEKIYAMQTGGAQPHVYPKHLADLKYLIPSNSKEQAAITQVLTIADSEFEALEKKLSLLKAQKTYLLNHLITGRIRTPENMPIS